MLDDFTGLVGFPGEMARLSPQLEMEDATEEEMVEYEGMIINALLAERRRFLGMTLQRVARMNDELGGGSLTLLGVMYHERGAYKGRRGDAKNSGAVGETQAAARRRGPRGSTTHDAGDAGEDRRRRWRNARRRRRMQRRRRRRLPRRSDSGERTCSLAPWWRSSCPSPTDR